MKQMVPLLILIGSAAVSGCQQDMSFPSEPATTPALSTAAAGLVFRQLTTGLDHSCGVTTTNLAYCWGKNTNGQLGDGTKLGKGNPVLVQGGLHFTQISAGDDHTCAVTGTGNAYCWGLNNVGQLGDGSTMTRTKPVAVKGGLVFRQVRPGSRFTCGATTGDLGYCWGSNGSGQLGIATIESKKLVPTAIFGGFKFRRVIAGGFHACGLTTLGKAYCWGRNVEGQLGINSTVRKLSPKPVVGGLTFTQVVTGGYHTCGVTTDKRAFCWGLNNSGQGGDGTNALQHQVPTLVAGGHLFKGVSPGFARTCGIVTDSKMWCWGWNQYGELGVDPSVTQHLRTPHQIPSPSFSEVAGGIAAHHTCGLTSTGTGYCWGYGVDGQTGDGRLSISSSPQPVSGPN
jgi:alpha-tubulin suppressor-like RCC1 family protein